MTILAGFPADKLDFLSLGSPPSQTTQKARHPSSAAFSVVGTSKTGRSREGSHGPRRASRWGQRGKALAQISLRKGHLVETWQTRPGLTLALNREGNEIEERYPALMSQPNKQEGL